MNTLLSRLLGRKTETYWTFWKWSHFYRYFIFTCSVLEIWAVGGRHHWRQAANYQWETHFCSLQRQEWVLACFDGEGLRQVSKTRQQYHVSQTWDLNLEQKMILNQRVTGCVDPTRTWRLALLQKLWGTLRVASTCVSSCPKLQIYGSCCAELENPRLSWVVAHVAE